jgi:hypothetical protein
MYTINVPSSLCSFAQSAVYRGGIEYHSEKNVERSAS